jgi:hypothetical protein
MDPQPPCSLPVRRSSQQCIKTNIACSPTLEIIIPPLQKSRRRRSLPTCSPRLKSPQTRINPPHRYPIDCTMASALSGHALPCTAATLHTMTPPPCGTSAGGTRLRDTARTTSRWTWPGWPPPRPGRPCPLTGIVLLSSPEPALTRRSRRPSPPTSRISCPRARSPSPSPTRTPMASRRRLFAIAVSSTTRCACPTAATTKQRLCFRRPSDHFTTKDASRFAEKQHFPTKRTNLDDHPALA